VSQAIRVAAELKVADLLLTEDRSIDDLAAATGSNAGALYRVMRLLSGEGVFREVSAGRFAVTEIGRALRSDGPTGPRNFLRMINSEAYLAFERLADSVRTGEPVFEAVFGKPRFDWLADHPAEAALFQQAMVSLGAGANEAVAEAYDFGSHSHVVDVGGGHGQLLSAILARHPDLKGTLFDREAGIASATSGPGDAVARTRLIAGDFFDSVPADADVYILKKVIHDWDDERAGKILENCRRAMRSHGKVLVAETLVPPDDKPDVIKFIDVTMLAITGGRERTEEEYGELLARARLRLDRVLPTKASISLLESSPI
jgi:SAM-dependent methyltransferase